MKNPFLPQSLMLETIATEDLANVEILDAKWENLNNIGEHAYFKFNVEIPATDGSPALKDSCGSSGPEPAYEVSFSSNDRSIIGVGIAFYRCDSVSDVGGGFGNQVFLAVQKAIYDYVKARKPYALQWSPVRKSSGQERKRKEGGSTRGRVYEMLSRTHLFPEYVSDREDHWVRKDLYDKFAVPEGYPAMSEDVSKSSTMRAKVAEIKRMREQSQNVPHDATNNVEKKIRAYAVEEMAKEKELKFKDLLDDPIQNPNKLKLGDLVDMHTNYPIAYQSFVNHESSHRAAEENINGGRDYGKILDLDFKSVPWRGGMTEMLLGKIFFVNEADKEHTDESRFDEYYVWLPLQILEKFKPEKRIEKINQRFKQFLDDPNNNPFNYDIGSEVIFIPNIIASQDYNSFGSIYYITNFEIVNKILLFKANYDRNIFEDANIDSQLKELYFTARYGQATEIRQQARDSWYAPANSANLAKAEKQAEEFVEFATNAYKGINFFGVKEGDKVVCTEGSSLKSSKLVRYGQIGEVTMITLNGKKTRVKIQWKNENILKDNENFAKLYAQKNTYTDQIIYREDEYQDEFFQKLNDEGIAEAKYHFEIAFKANYLDFVENPRYNPEKLKVGDVVFTVPKASYKDCADHTEIGAVGTITGIYVDHENDFLNFDVLFDKSKSESLMSIINNSVRPDQILSGHLRYTSHDRCSKIVLYTPANIMLYKKQFHLYLTSKDVYYGKSNLSGHLDRWSRGFSAFKIGGNDLEINQKIKVAAGWTTSPFGGEKIGDPFIGQFRGVSHPGTASVRDASGHLQYVPFDKITPIGRPELRRNYLQQIQSLSLKIGDAVKVSRGIHSNKHGHIINYGPKKSFAGAYAIVKTMPDDNTPSEKIVVNLDDLVPSDELSKVESYKAILNRMNRYFEWKNK